VLEKHKQEVWYVKFSNDGTHFASTSKDHSIIFWKISKTAQLNELKITLLYKIKAHQKDIQSIDWSKSNQYLLSSSTDTTAKIWELASGRCIRTLQGHSEAVSSVAWCYNDTKILTAGIDKLIILWNFEGEKLYTWTTLRIADIACCDSLEKLVAICASNTHIIVFNMKTKQEEFQLNESDKITSMCLSKSGRHLLVNVSLKLPRIVLWDLERSECVTRYTGHQQERYMLRCSFGGINESLVVCGSEDSGIYIWHRKTAALISVLRGHTGTVNSVHWNPTDPHMLISASDDLTIKIWGLESEIYKVVIDDDVKRKELSFENDLIAEYSEDMSEDLCEHDEDMEEDSDSQM